MLKGQAQNIVKETLQNDFNKERFVHFVKNLLNHIEDAPFVYRGNTIPRAYEHCVSTFERIGKYSDGETKLDILIVKLKKETTLERARTEQRNFIAWYLNGSRGGEQKDAALVAFVSPNSADWRFSLVKMEYKFEEGKSGKIKINEEYTPAKRWSFLVGANEDSHTAQSKLVPIIEDENVVTLTRLEEAFGIEKVTKEFFEKYRDLFLRVKDELDDLVKKDEKISADFQEKNVETANLAKKVLGQIVFLYFLQKKGWFGVPMDQSWGGGDKKFLRTLFKEAVGKNKNYFNDYLEPLFYEALAKDRDEGYYSRFDCKIPFLNGGLFDPMNNYDWVNTEIDLPNDIFSNDRKIQKTGDIGDGILDIFDRYNFTVKEDEPLEKEVAVDPEMLGKVFENLLEVKDRKSKGTYYTPREIVNYMCEQSTLNYLATELEGLAAKEDIEVLIKHGETVSENEVKVEMLGRETDTYYYKLPESVRLNARIIDDKLATIKVCDPAIGSGAFPVGMMNIIVKTRMVLNSYLCHSREGENVCPDRTLYHFKRDCIQNSLYGVDIDPGAVEIAKLRLWLSLVVDEDDIKQIKPLPNLDYKIMQGNSLLEEFEGIKLFDEKLISAGNADSIERLEALKLKQDMLQKEYLELHSQNKLTQIKQAELSTELKKIQAQIKKCNQSEKTVAENTGLFDMHSEAKKKASELKRLHKEFFETTQKSKKDTIKKQIEQLEWGLIEATLKEQNKISALEKLEEFKRSNTKPFFLWRLNFADVFEDRGGFDVVIANPPYGVVYDKELKHLYENKFVTFSRNNDIYVAFYEHGENILKNDGFLVYITPNTFLNGDYFNKLRELFANKTKINEIIDYKEFQIFADPTVFVCIFSCTKKQNINFPYTYNIGVPISLTENIQFLPVLVASKEEEKYKPKNAVLSKILGMKGVELLDKIFYVKDVGFNYWTKGKGKKRDGDSIGDRIFYHGEKQNDKDIPFLKGRDIQKYHFQKPTNYLKFDYEKFLDKESDTFRFSRDFLSISPKIIYRQTSSRIIATIDFDSNLLDKTVHLIVPRNNESMDLKFILAVLNSTLINYIYKYISQEREGRTFSQVKATYIKQIPIPLITINEQNPFIFIIDQIFDITKESDYDVNSEKQAKVHDLEHQIDELVYKLYGLTDDEIKIVEAKR